MSDRDIRTSTAHTRAECFSTSWSLGTLLSYLPAPELCAIGIEFDGDEVH